MTLALESMSELKVTDRRWWAKGDGNTGAPASEEPRLKPTYIEELEARLAAKDAELQQILSKYRGAADEFEQARARLRKEVSKDVERGRRSLLVSFLEILDNLDRALASAGEHRAADPFVQGVSIVRQQFLLTLDGLGVKRVDPLGQMFDPSAHEAVAGVAAHGLPDGQIVGVVRPGYLIGDEVLRPAQVAVARTA
jgi:molecular chaperone GrpE